MTDSQLTISEPLKQSNTSARFKINQTRSSIRITYIFEALKHNKNNDNEFKNHMVADKLLDSCNC